MPCACPPLSTAARAAELPDPQRLALQALLRGASQADAATEAGVGDRTLRRWLHDPDFLAALRQARCELWTETTSRLQRAAALAVDTLCEVMESAEQPYARVQAARVVLEFTARALDLDALSGRAAQIERDLEARLQSEAGVPPPDPEDGRVEGDAGAPPPGEPAGPQPAPAVSGQNRTRFPGLPCVDAAYKAAPPSIAALASRGPWNGRKE